MDRPTVTPTALINYIGSQHTSDEEAKATQLIAQAKALIDQFIQAAPVPEPVYIGAVLEVGSKLHLRRGDQTVSTIGDSPVGLPAKDPMVTVYPMLTPFMGGGFA